ncbi:type II secretion system F family protein [Candidatus Micrarchaeota archaeon]|nr:type II secretion system F family protein [Candidatus Micrarchaeota archaeon]
MTDGRFRRMFAVFFFISLLVGLISLAFLPLIHSLMLGACLFVLSFAVYYVFILYRREQVKQDLERILPDFLLILSSNIRAGMNPVLALKNSVRPEFGPLSEDLMYVVNKSMGTDSFIDALYRIAQKYRSDTFTRVIDLYITGYLSGGDLARMLEELAEDIQETRDVERQVSLGVNLYTVFLIFSVVLVMPFLFGLAYTFLSSASSITQQPIPSFSLNLLFTTYLGLSAFLTGILLGVIKTGHMTAGLPRGILFSALSMMAFHISVFILGKMFV